MKRSICGLVRAGLLLMQSEERLLILKCELASRGYFVQNKAATNPLQKATLNQPLKTLVDTESSAIDSWKVDTDKTSVENKFQISKVLETQEHTTNDMVS